MANVLFEGQFNLDDALNAFNKFASVVEARLKKMSQGFASGQSNASGRGFSMFGVTEKEVVTAEKAITNSQKRVGDGFINLAIRSYALHQVGSLLNQAVTVPLRNLTNEIIAVTLRFDTLEKLLTERGGRSLEEVGKAIDGVGKAAKLRNLDLDTAVTLYSRLFEATRGAIDDQLFEKITKGLSNVLTTIEAGEKRAFFGQIQDVLGGGNVANLERTLSLAPALKSVFDEIKAGSGDALTDQETLIQSFEKLGQLPALTDLATKVKNIRVELELFAYRIGQIYKDNFEALIDFINAKALPALDGLLDRFEQASPMVQGLVAALAGLAAILAPVISTLGTLVLLFPSFTAESAFIGRLVAMLTNLPALLNPVTAIITGLIAILTKAFNQNAGGFADALRYLIDVLSGTFGTVLTSIFETVKNLWDVLKNFYNLIDSIIPLTEIIGTIGAALAIIIAQAISLINLIAIIPATLRFIADLLNGDIMAAFDRLYINLLKILNNLGPLKDLIEAIFGVDLSKSIQEAERDLARLEGTTSQYYDDSEEGAKATMRAQNELSLAYKRTQVSIQLVTEQIKEQNFQIDAQIIKNRQAAQERHRQLQEYILGMRAASYGDDVAAMDLTTPEGIAQAQGRLGSQLGTLQIQANEQASARIEKNLRAQLGKVRENIIKVLQDASKEGGQKLGKEVQELYQSYQFLVEQQLMSSDAVGEASVTAMYNVLDKKIKGYKLTEPQLRLLFNFVGSEKALFQQVYQGEINNKEEQLKFQQESDRLSKQLNERISAAQNQEKRAGRGAILEEQLKDADERIARGEQLKQFLIEALDTAQNVYEWERQLLLADEKLLELQQQRNAIREKIAGNEATTAGDLDRRINAIRREGLQYKRELQEQNKDASRDAIRKLGDDEKRQAEERNVLLRQLAQLNEESVEIFSKLGSIGQERTLKDVRNYNDTLDGIFQSLTSIKWSELRRTALFAIPALKSISTGVNPEIEKVIKQIAITAQSDLSKPETRKSIMEQSDAIIEMLQGYIKAGDLSVTAKLQLQKFLEAYIEMVRTIAEGQEVLSRKISPALASLQIKQSDLEIQQNIVDLTQEELELTREILKIRTEAYVPNVKSVGDFGKAVIDIITGNRKAQYELEKAILEQQKRSAEIEIELAITRLRIEQEIFILKLKEQGATEAEIRKVRDQFERQIDLLKEKGELQRLLIDEQMKQLREFAGSISEVFSQIFGKVLGKIFGQKDKSKVQVQDEHGDWVDIKEEEENPEPTDEPMISDDSVDGTEKNVDETLGWLDRLKGGLGVTKDAIFALGDAISSMNDLSIKSILRTLKQELKALGAKYAIKALEYAALAVSAAVFGDWGTAGRAALAAAAWGAASAAAYAGAGLIGTIDGNGAANTQASAARSAGTSNAATPDRDKAVLKQQALSVFINLDIRTDDGIIIKKNVKAINQNTQLTNLTMNGQEGWAFPPTP